MIYELLGYNTDCRYHQDIRYRRYTTSAKLAKQFERIPRIQFTDSGHGIVFTAREHHGSKRPDVSTVSDHKEWKAIRAKAKKEYASKPIRTSQFTFRCVNNAGIEASFDIGVSYLGFYLDNKKKLVEDKTGIWYKCPSDYFEVTPE